MTIDIDNHFYNEGCQYEANGALYWALNHYLEGSEIGDPRCMYRASLILKETEPRRAFELTARGVARGSTDCLALLGQFYSNGTGVPLNSKRAFSLFSAAAKAHHPEALYQLGLCYEHGIGTEPNRAMAQSCYEQATDAGHSEAPVKAGQSYLSIEENLQKALRVFQSAVNHGHTRYWREVAHCHKLLHNPRQEAHAYACGAAQGQPHCQYNLAHCYLKGRGVTQDRLLALDLLHRCSRQHPQAQFELKELDPH